jgi:transcriptional regulator GlxA family with amidase domain
LLGVPASALTDRYVKLDGLWGRPGSELVEDLLATRSAHDAVDRLVQAVWGRAQQAFEPASARIARRAVRLLEGPAADPGAPVRVESVARQLGITPRHLRRAFTESVGIGPKDFARTVRLRRTLRMVGPSADWGRIAADAGYYDQAHLIAEFRELVGFTPGAFLRHTAGRSASGLPSPLPSCRSGLPTRDRRFGKSLLPP